MTLRCTVPSPLVSLVRELGRSVFAASISHGTLNAVAGVSILLHRDARVFWNGIVGFGGIAVFALASIAAIAFFRPVEAGPTPR